MLELNPDSFVIYAMAEGFKPDPLLTVTQWADENRYLSTVASSEPGRWHMCNPRYGAGRTQEGEKVLLCHRHSGTSFHCRGGKGF